MDDRLLHYHEPSTPPQGRGFSRYGTTATCAALVGAALGVLTLAYRLPQALDPLIAGCVIFCAGVAVVGWILAAIDRANWRPLFWVAVVVAAIGIFAFGVSTGFIRF